MPEVNPPPSALPRPAPMRRKHTRTAEPRVLILPPTPPVRSPRAATIVRWFGLEQAIRQRTESAHATLPAPIRLDLVPGTITLVTGPSGAGKSSLLRDAQRASRSPHAPNAPHAPVAPNWPDAPDAPDSPIAPHAPGAPNGPHASNAPHTSTAPDAQPTTWIDLAAIPLPDVPVVDVSSTPPLAA